MNCYICKNETFQKVEGKVRDRPEVGILKCRECGLVFLESFDHIDDHYYSDSKMREDIVQSDWEGYRQKSAFDDVRRHRWIQPQVSGKTLLDFGCGSGGFLYRIKESTKKCAGLEKDKALQSVIEEKLCVRVYSDIGEVDEKFDIITLFHVLEHLKDPSKTLIALSELLTEEGKIIIEVPSCDDALLSLYRCKEFSEFTYWSCHLFLFNTVTLRKLIESLGLKVDFISQIQRYPISNHLHWLATGKPGGHENWSFLDSPELNKQYEDQLARRGLCDTIIASIKK